MKKEDKKIINISCEIGNSFCNIVGDDNYVDTFDSCFTQRPVGNGIVENTLILKDSKNKGTCFDMNFNTTQQLDYADTKELSNTVFVSYAIARYLIKNEIEDKDVIVNLCLGVPAKTYDKKHCDEVRGWFKDKTINFNFEGKNYSYKVNEVVVVGQGMVYQMVHKKELEKYDNVYLIDIGSFTLDIVKVTRGNIDKENIFSPKCGSNSWLPELRDRIDEEFHLENLSIKQVEKFVIDNSIPFDNKPLPLKRKYKDIYLKALTNLWTTVVRTTKSDIKIANKIIVFGGGALTWGEALKKQINKIEIPENPQLTNAECYYKVLKAYLASKKKEA